MRVWRISRHRHVHTAFTGDGARFTSGRWNPAGVPMVYTSLSLSLAAIEVFVHLDPLEEPGDLVSIEATLPIDELSCERITADHLPADWRRLNHPELQKIGEQWIQSGRSLALMVPSAAVAQEWNVLLNPAHPQAKKIRVAEPKPFHFDARMFRNR